jgi:hypothetical protein
MWRCLPVFTSSGDRDDALRADTLLVLMVRPVILTCCALLAAGCLGYPGPRSVENEDPAVKIPAIRRAVEANDRSVMPQLVKDLDSDDAAVRFAAINALQRFTDQTFDYRWTETDPGKRFPSVKRWQNLLAGRPIEEGVEPTTLTTRPTTAPATRPATTQE